MTINYKKKYLKYKQKYLQKKYGGVGEKPEETQSENKETIKICDADKPNNCKTVTVKHMGVNKCDRIYKKLEDIENTIKLVIPIGQPPTHNSSLPVVEKFTFPDQTNDAADSSAVILPISNSFANSSTMENGAGSLGALEKPPAVGTLTAMAVQPKGEEPDHPNKNVIQTLGQ